MMELRLILNLDLPPPISHWVSEITGTCTVTLASFSNGSFLLMDLLIFLENVSRAVQANSVSFGTAIELAV